MGRRLGNFKRERLGAVGSSLFLNEPPACVGNRCSKKPDLQVNGGAELPEEISANLIPLVKKLKKKDAEKTHGEAGSGTSWAAAS